MSNVEIVEPGEPFNVPYGTKGKFFTTRSLSSREQREVMKEYKVANALLSEDPDKGVDALDAIIKKLFPEVTEAFLQDESSMAMKHALFTQAISGTRVSLAQQKKSE